MKRNIETFLGCENEYKESAYVVFGAPFDSTTSYRPGTRFASKVMRGESYGLETYSPYLDHDLEDVKVYDGGDLELCFGNITKALEQIEVYVEGILKDQKIPVMIGGEHLVTLGAMLSVVEMYPDIHIIHFDAHADLREEYLGATLSHATVMRRIWDLVGDHRIYQFGIRSGEKKEFIFAKEHVAMQPFNLEGIKEVVAQLKGKPVYITVDLDVLDPAVFPGTGTPEPGGVDFMTLLEALQVVSSLNIVGCDMVELSPTYDQSGVSTMVACKLLREFLLAMDINRKKKEEL